MSKAIIQGHTVRRTVTIGASREAVWAAITEPERIAQWLGDRATLSGTDIGATGTFGWSDYGDSGVEVTAVEPLTVWEYRWAGEPGPIDEDDVTTVRMTLSDGEDGTTVLDLVESGFETIKAGTAYRRGRLEGNRDGWNTELDELVALLEN